jgi:ribosomal protein L24
MKIGDLVKVNRGENTGKLGKIVLKRVHDLQYTSFTLCKVEFKEGEFEWINVIYLKKVI